MFKKYLIFICLLLFIGNEAIALTRFANLEKELRQIAYKKYSSKVAVSKKIGIAFKDLRSGTTISVNGNVLFPAASVIKLPVMAYVFYLSDKKLLNLNEKLYFSNKDKLPGAGVLQWLRPNSYSIWNLCRMMISISDNTATQLLIKRTGKRKINLYCRKIGLNNTYLRDQTALVELPKKNINQTTPLDIARLLYRVEKHIGFSKSARKDMLSFMRNQKYTFGIPYVLPRGVVCANKTGNLTRILHDTAIVYTPRGNYVLCVFTKGFVRDHYARKVINRVSEVVYGYYR